MSQGEVWPLPQKIEFFSENRTVRRGSINLVFQGQRDVDCDILDFMKKTYHKRWFFPGKPTCQNPGGINLIIRLDKCPEKNEYPQHDMNEE
ncbi:Protein HEX-1, partial [Aphelenchoides avenae]